MAEYTESFAQFILQAQDAYDELCDKIDRGLVLADHAATVKLTVPAGMVDQIRRERLLIAASKNGNGDG